MKVSMPKRRFEHPERGTMIPASILEELSPRHSVDEQKQPDVGCGKGQKKKNKQKKAPTRSVKKHNAVVASLIASVQEQKGNEDALRECVLEAKQELAEQKAAPEPVAPVDECKGNGGDGGARQDLIDVNWTAVMKPFNVYRKPSTGLVGFVLDRARKTTRVIVTGMARLVRWLVDATLDRLWGIRIPAPIPRAVIDLTQTRFEEMCQESLAPLTKLPESTFEEPSFFSSLVDSWCPPRGGNGLEVVATVWPYGKCTIRSDEEELRPSKYRTHNREEMDNIFCVASVYDVSRGVTQDIVYNWDILKTLGSSPTGLTLTDARATARYNAQGMSACLNGTPAMWDAAVNGSAQMHVYESINSAIKWRIVEESLDPKGAESMMWPRILLSGIMVGVCVSVIWSCRQMYRLSRRQNS